MLLVHALVLALVQGAAAILPISADGHALAVPYLAGWEPAAPAFALSLHAGALIALCWYFRSDLWFLATRAVGRADDADELALARRTIALLALASLPAVVAGVALGPVTDALAGDVRLLAVALAVTAGALAGAELVLRRRAAAEHATGWRQLPAAERRRDRGRDEGTTTPGDALALGLVQAAALLPGLSRTGLVMATGVARGLSRTAAARLALLLSVPIVAGLTVGQALQVGYTPGTVSFGLPLTLLALGVSTLAARWAIRFLLRLVQRQDLLGFARYVASLAVLLVLARELIIG